MIQARTTPLAIGLIALLCGMPGAASGKDGADAKSQVLTLEQLKATGPQRSSYQHQHARPAGGEAPQPQLDTFRRDVQPILTQSCIDCHGPDTQEGNVRIDTLDPDLLGGKDTDWWVEIRAAISKGEMPPADAGELADEERAKVVDWLTGEIQNASTVRRAREEHTSFRRLTRYEFNYALQDLLGLPYDFAGDLPPEPVSEDGFQNSSEMLAMSTVQFGYFRDLSRAALQKAMGPPQQPAPIYWGISFHDRAVKEWAGHEKQLNKLRKEQKDNPEKLEEELKKLAAKFHARPGNAHFKNLETGETESIGWAYNGAKFAWKSSDTLPEVPAVSQDVAILPRGQKLIVELGDKIPDEGLLRVRVRASRTAADATYTPSLRLEFGWHSSNNSAASTKISQRDLPITASPEAPEFYEFEVPLSEVYPRNSARGETKMGQTPSPSEYVKLVNSSVSQGDIQVDYVEVTAPVYHQWPPQSQTHIFVDSDQKSDEPAYAREVLESFMTRAWRRQVTPAEVDRKLDLFAKIRPQCEDFQFAMIEVLSTVLASPQFLYVVQTDQAKSTDDYQLATRLAMFLWCSVPDEELIELASRGELRDPNVLGQQVERMLGDPRARRFAEQFVYQWLGMDLLEHLSVDKKVYPQFDAELKSAMQEEPIAFFTEVLKENDSVLDFLHADYVLVNERLAKHYGLKGIAGNDFRKVSLDADSRRGGLMTQAGLLAMNSDGKDSHPLKRGIWMLESLLNDPPPPPPAAVPVIDLADPNIAKMTLKQRIENHRNQAACNSCHAKIDPWGIAFENFDAVGGFRTEVQGQPVDASSLLFNQQKLEGVDGLKRFLLENRQDQFVRAMVHKLTTYALGRPMTFGDHAEVDQITAEVRQHGDGLGTMITAIVSSELFQAN
ncbi:DUF1592 domain-containing protein [Blastopirellula sp. JC732]|uniref:DUF1592 domain-containing protein n=1 Tax=Blastopirellula sediminis TaxID=2894196 RepID=A0A9X1MJ20_9BACT|nr:DUF1592 domain-containing protein [Blastopirellula sediminis]MCC9607741.1 DUF1592 domain-containing protein [Blastopirellula sediminis]MCC9627466.1 DUF1592 domain-containing protein [Blastopirellula sediminis]